jgi:hypothetical protein
MNSKQPFNNTMKLLDQAAPLVVLVIRSQSEKRRGKDPVMRVIPLKKLDRSEVVAARFVQQILRGPCQHSLHIFGESRSKEEAKRFNRLPGFNIDCVGLPVIQD